MEKSKSNTGKKISNSSKKSNPKTSWKSTSNNTGKKISNKSKQSNPNTSSNSHMSMIKKVYGADYGKKGVEMNGFFRENGYYAIAEFLENGK